MVFKRFRIQIFLRVLLLVLSIILLYYIYIRTRYNISLFILGLLIIGQVILLIKYVERTNKKLSQFLQSIRHSDFSSSFSDKGLGRSFEDLNKEFSKVIDDFKKSRTEKEEHYNYLQTLVQHISIGIIVFTRDGRVDIINNAFKKLLKMRSIRFIKDLAAIKSDFPDILLKLNAGEKTLVKIFLEDELLQLSISATEFRMRGEEYILVSLQNISSELDEKEIESWQKLIRVLTHEITNSITPISSLASTVREMLLQEDNVNTRLNKLNLNDIQDIESAITTIQNRSQGLLNFVEVYRNLTRIPKPNFRYFPLKDVFNRSLQLLKPKIDEYGIICAVKVFPPDIMITADPDLLDQIIINLMLNAIDAVKEVEEPEILILVTLNQSNRVIIDFQDNGYGIKPDILDKIFMPFFTSKKDGSGIGLSLSRQIMHLHKGSIKVKSKPDEGTVFTLTF
jgi:nitrogen fixation/metabolism regulation signal transduction histidine kinase